MSTPRRARRQVSRSSSFLGAIKTIVTAPLSWFSAEVPQNGAKRKQQAAPSPYDVIHSDDDEDQSSDYGSSRVKRMRLDSPPASQPYLDPPASAFTHSLPTLPSRNPPRRNISRDVSMSIPEEPAPFAISRDRSMPLPSKTSSFRMRTSLTPQPSGPGFGPTIRRPERDASEPPPLTSLMTNPIFVRAPSEQVVSSQPSTLGSLADSRRISRSSSRSSILFGSQPPPNSAAVRVTNAAEQALHELEIYKTPLLPTRLRGSSGIPEMFKQRKHPPIVLMREREDKGRLGKGRKTKKSKEVVNESKPYAGAGGMKKLLAKIRDEGETVEQKSPEKEVHKSPERLRSPPKAAPAAELPPLPEPFRVEPRPSTQSSLRVGRSKQTRSHAHSVTRPSKSRFSAVYEEDDNMDEDEDARDQERQMLEEAAKSAPAFNIPSNFSFAKDVPPLPQPSSTSEAKEPPIASLPFSFAKPSPSPERSAAPSPPSIRPAVPTPAPAPPAPAFSFNAPPTPAKAPVAEEPPKSVSSVPNFFAKSPAVIPLAPTPPVGNMFSQSSAPVADTSSPFWSDKPKKVEQKEPAPAPPAPAPSFGGFGAPTPTSIFGAAPAPSSLFGSQPPKDAAVEKKEPEVPKSLFTPSIEPPKPAESATPSPSLFAAPAATTNTPAFTFGAPTPKDTSTPEPAVEAPKPSPATASFSFGQPAPAPTVEAPKPLFGGSTTPAFTFGQSAPKPTETPKPEEKAVSPFSFGAPPATPPAADANKGPFSFGAAAPSSPFSFGAPSAAAAAPESKPSFSFGAPSTPARPGTPPRVADSEMNMDESPTRDLQAPIAGTSFATKPVVATGFSFGTSNGGALFGTSSTPTSATSPFTFGAPSANTFSSTKPETKIDEKPVSSPFSFGQATQDSTKPTSTGFAFGQKAEEKPASTGFSFGQQQPSATGGGFSFGAGASESPRPSTTGSFAFGTPPPSTTSPFQPQPLQLSNSTGSQFSFGQSGSAPSSPAAFHQTPAFAFGAPTSATSATNPFAFGSSQPASPATSNSGLPSTNGGGGFSFGSGNPSSSPAFTPSTPTSTNGGNLFTIGSSSNAPPPANGPRVTRRLPTRRGGKR